MISRTKQYILLAASAFMLSTATFAQDTAESSGSENSKEAKGDKYYEDYAFMDAREAYIKAVDNGYRSANLLSKLADSYYYNGEYEEASKWYGALFSFSEEIDSEYVYRYAQSLKSIVKYATADRVMKRLNEVAKEDDRGALFKEEPDYLKSIELQSGRFNIFPVPFNSEYSDYGPTLNTGALIFTSNRKTRTASQHFHDWDDQPFSELYSIL
ncbi:MAG: flagellar motor protein MotB, partial [Flavobacteriaceae bacterium]|nr:flagellar motor protein MotB [Flavobacteriaceae bacterium]